MSLISSKTALALSLAFIHPLTAETITVYAAADTTLVETAPDNNLGGQPHFNVGTTRLNPGTRNRGLFRFDLAQPLPPGSQVTRVQLRVESLRPPNGAVAVASEFQVHRLLNPWGEGDKSNSFSPGLGLAATLGEATWNHRFALTTNLWDAPGGAPGSDYVALRSAGLFVEDDDYHTYDSTSSPRLLDDVQSWVDHPDQNYGWLMRSNAESTQGTARRFAARAPDLPDSGPRLIVEFIPFEISPPQRQDNRLLFSFSAAPGQSYQLQQRDHLTNGGWSTIQSIAPPLTPTNISLSVPITSSQGFFQISTQP